MTLRELTDEQVREFQKECEKAIERRQTSRSDANPINTIDAKLFFSDGMKAVLARISNLP
jgi:hypothetical protein